MAILRRSLHYFRADARALVLLLCVLVAQALASLLQAWPMALLVDVLVGAPPASGHAVAWVRSALPDGRAAAIMVCAGATLVLRLMQELLTMTRTLLGHHVGYGGVMRLRCELFRKLQALHLEYHHREPQADAMYRLANDTTGVQALLDVAVSLLVSAVTLAAMAVVMLGKSPPLTLVAVTIAPVLLWVNVRFGRRLKSCGEHAKKAESELTTVIQRSLTAVGLAQAYRREPDEFARFQSTAKTSVGAWLRLHRDQVHYVLAVGALFGAGGAAVLGYGAGLVSAGEMTVGDLTIFLAYLGMLYDPLCKLSGASGSLAGGATGAQRVFDVLDRPRGIDDAPDAIALAPGPRTLGLHGVDFHYPGREPVLRDVDVRVAPGQMVAFVGESGSGKTTLLNLLPRFYDPTRGSLTLDGVDLRRLRLEDVRRHVALVLQESVILPSTIAENIAFGRADATCEEIRAAAELAGAARFIEALPAAYDTRLDEGGRNLSGGQRQRIGIARALVTHAPILVLDEPTSALDPEHERIVTESLAALKGSRTIVVVSHRMSTVAGCDVIHVMRRGRIVESGDHESLLALGGLYHRMVRGEVGGLVPEVRLVDGAPLASSPLGAPSAVPEEAPACWNGPMVESAVAL
jgi:ABC-type multidrug transport system fused ATPase/permease subunit